MLHFMPYDSMRLPLFLTGHRKKVKYVSICRLLRTSSYNLENGEAFTLGIHFGLAFDAQQQIQALPILLQNLELRDGLCFTHDIGEANLTTGSEFSLMVKNTGTSLVSLPVNTTACKLILHSEVQDNILWSCPKCKLGGVHREHTREKGCRYAPNRQGQQVKAKAAPKKKDESSTTSPSVLAPGPTQDPQPLKDSEGDGILQPPEPKGGVVPSPAMDQNHAPLPTKPKSPKAPSKDKLVLDAYQRLKGMKYSDITLHLHEHLKNLDAAWLTRIPPSIVMEHANCYSGTSDGLTPDDQRNVHLLHSQPIAGSVLLLVDILLHTMDVQSVILTKDPTHLVIAPDKSFGDAPFRISFLGHQVDCWESSSIERLDELTPDHRHCKLRQHTWLITLIGSQPIPYKNSEQRILPRLKLGTQKPNFDFTKLRQNLIDNNSDQDRIRLLKGLHEKLWHELKDGMERLLRRLGVPERCYELIDTVIQTCEQCNAFKPVPRRPKFGSELAGHFGDVLMVDLFYIFNM